jgi:heme/copper-type cytochrome/quinol oxidase subunit 2
MPIVVDVRSKDDFDAWLKATAAAEKQAAAPAPPAATPSATPHSPPVASAG